MKYFIILCILSHASICYSSKFIVRDSQTGAAIDAEVLIQTINEATLTPEHWKMIKLGQSLPADVTVIKQHNPLSQDYFFRMVPNKYLQVINISASEYLTLQTYITANAHIPITQIMMDRVNNNHQSSTKYEQVQISGYLYDQTTIQPLAEVAVNLSGDQFYQQVITDQYGFFSLAEALPKTLSLTIEHKGYQSQRRTDIETHSPINLIIDLKPGSGKNETSMLHPLLGMHDSLIDYQSLSTKLSQDPHTDSSSYNKERPSGAIFLEPPTSIKVGFNGTGGTCCGANCSTSQVYSFETYVQRGLDNEWIASWDAESLKAGSIPYRSYGAWHVINDVYTDYDICAGPCCQAFEYTGYAATINAAISTNGIMLDQNGAIARSEYSAQNNSWDDPNDGLSCTNTDLSCGDGSVGSPATGWPCLSDAVSTGLGCFGHGRGMSQWGTQFRAQDGQSFADIVDHYYNANNNPSSQRNQYASTPLRFDATSTNQSVISEFDTFMINFEVFNASDTNHTFGPILLGASLYDGNNYYSDPNNDLDFQITQAGTSVLQRPFQMDSNMTANIYDLITAIYLDVDNDNQISSIDWLLQVNTQPAALIVLAKNDLIFRDSF